MFEIRVEEWPRTSRGLVYYMRCREGHTWTKGAEDSSLHWWTPPELRAFIIDTLTCQVCQAAERVGAMLRFEADDYLRVPGGAE